MARATSTQWSAAGMACAEPGPLVPAMSSWAHRGHALVLSRTDRVSAEQDRACPSCPVCAANAWGPPLGRTRLRRCRGCGTILNARSATRTEEEGRYRGGSAALSPNDLSVGGAQWRWVRRAVFGPQLPGPAAVLDVGCGCGAFLRAASEAGARVAGLELDPRAVDVCRRDGLQVMHGSPFDAALPTGPWDLITL